MTLDNGRLSSYLVTVKNVVRACRMERGLSQAGLGDALGVSRQTINAIETGRYLPSLPLAFALACYFGSSIEDLFVPEEGETPCVPKRTPGDPT
jgi:putative transcriptional regulator